MNILHYILFRIYCPCLTSTFAVRKVHQRAPSLPLALLWLPSPRDRRSEKRRTLNQDELWLKVPPTLWGVYEGSQVGFWEI